MRILLFLVGCTLCSCSSLGWTNEDAGHSVLASNVSVPANGSVVYTIERNPRTDALARQYHKDMGMSRSYFSWFGTKKDSGKVRTHGGPNGS